MPDKDSGDDATRTHFDCPWCAEVSKIETWLAVGVSHALPVDPILDPPNRLRFLPSRFNPDGRPVDPDGVPCDLLACPRCRRGVPWTGVAVPRLRVSPSPALLSAIEIGEVLNDEGQPLALVHDTNSTPDEIRTLIIDDDHLLQILSNENSTSPILDVLADGRTLGPLPLDF